MRQQGEEPSPAGTGQLNQAKRRQKGVSRSSMERGPSGVNINMAAYRAEARCRPLEAGQEPRAKKEKRETLRRDLGKRGGEYPNQTAREESKPLHINTAGEAASHHLCSSVQPAPIPGVLPIRVAAPGGAPAAG